MHEYSFQSYKYLLSNEWCLQTKRFTYKNEKVQKQVFWDTLYNSLTLNLTVYLEYLPLDHAHLKEAQDHNELV